MQNFAQKTLKIALCAVFFMGMAQSTDAQVVSGFYWDSASLNFQIDGECNDTPPSDDGNGFYYYGVTNGSCLISNNTKEYTEIPTKEQGYNYWIFSRNTINALSGRYFRVIYRDVYNNSYIHNFPTGTTTYSINNNFVDASGFKWSRFDGSNTPVGTYRLDQVLVGGFSLTAYYGVFYTNADLSYVDTQTELYALLGSFAPTDDTQDTEVFYTQYNTRFTGISYATSSIDVGYFIDPSEADANVATKNPTLVRFSYSKKPSTDFSRRSFSIEDAISPTWGNGTTTGIFSLDANAEYDFMVSFANSGTIINGVIPFDLAYVYFSVTTNASGTIESVDNVDFYNAQTPKTNDTIYQPCGITDLTGCFINALIFIFYPSDASLNRFTTTWQQIEYKKPFGYVTVTIEQLQSLNTTASSTFSLGNDLPFETAIFDPIRIALGSILWGIFAIYFYHRIKKIDL